MTGDINLSAEELAKATGGTWSDSSTMSTFLRITLGTKLGTDDLQPGDLLVTTNKDQWNRLYPNSESDRVLDMIIAQGAAAVVRKTSEYAGANLLRVENTYKALRAIAKAVRAKSLAKHILVTGTEGKTGFKILFSHLTTDQIELNCKLDSKNMTASICLAVANTKQHHQISVIEAAVPRLQKGTLRSHLIKPDLCVITEIGYEHLAGHGSVEKLIAAKASVVSGLQPGGCCLIKSEPRYYQKLRNQILAYGDISIITFGNHADDYAQLLGADFDSERLGWHVRSRVASSEYAYFLPVLEDHAPLSSLGVLAAISLAGLDLSKAIDRFHSYQPFQTSGRYYNLRIQGGHYSVYDQSFRSSVLGMSDFFKVAARLEPRNGGRKILVLGPVYDEKEYGPLIWELLPPSHLSNLVEQAGFARIYTIGKAEDFQQCLEGLPIAHRHFNNPNEIIVPLADDLRANDLLMIKGDSTDGMIMIAAALRERAA
jgi:UDP-N-acetylmuramoyl-tripeptide--D-alanyl-D-alanine ligase